MKHAMVFSGRLWVAVATCMTLVSCEHADPLEQGSLQPTLASIQENIFDQSCAVPGCHTGSSPPMDLDLSSGEAESNLVGVDSREVPSLKRVDPGNPDDSYLVRKIEGAPGIVGGRMPLNRAPLSSEEIAVVRDWITGGAE